MGIGFCIIRQTGNNRVVGAGGGGRGVAEGGEGHLARQIWSVFYEILGGYSIFCEQRCFEILFQS